ncbi:MAG: hypothetical protein ACK4MQ_07520 [Hyphomonas sp.]
MSKPASVEGFAKNTGRDWNGWLEFLGAIGAKDLSHKEIAARIAATGEASGWWAQQITVAYEQHIGRRAPGQRSDGAFEVAVSKTLAGSMDEALAAWQKLAGGRTEFGGVAIAAAPETSATEKWRYWRCGLADGTKLTVTITGKAPGKAGLTVTHDKLASAEDKERWRAFWKAELSAL